ncbi:hypothetical protein DYH55_20555 [Methylovirgula sp. 4M-Z18]|nr:hypothetical protein DYH55_20555 [Methylovirgula sp. 4M-Z18]
MKVRMHHAVFGTLLIATLLVNSRPSEIFPASENMVPAIIRVGEAGGLAFQEPATASTQGQLTFDAPGCPGPVYVTVLFLTFEDEPLIGVARGNYSIRYVYLDSTWKKRDRIGVYLKRTSQAALALLGLSRYTPGWHLLRIDAPIGCEAVDAVDWRLVWDRDYLPAVSS